MSTLPLTIVSLCTITSDRENPLARPDHDPSTVCTGARGVSLHATTAASVMNVRSLRIALETWLALGPRRTSATRGSGRRLLVTFTTPRIKQPGGAFAPPGCLPTLIRERLSRRPYLQTGSPSDAPATTGFVVLIPTPHEAGRVTWLWLTVAHHEPVPVVIAGDETLFVLWNFRNDTV